MKFKFEHQILFAWFAHLDHQFGLKLGYTIVLVLCWNELYNWFDWTSFRSEFGDGIFWFILSKVDLNSIKMFKSIQVT